jgi:hypothetical protein
MIVKLGESLKWESFRKRSVYVKAVRMIEDFLFETTHGWVQGHKGQWLVEVDERVRHNLDNEAFLRTYREDRRGREPD